MAVSTAASQNIDSINACLPQTQCTRCGYPTCRDYASAIHLHSVPVNRCPPGGTQALVELAELTGQPCLALDSDYGTLEHPTVVVIDESACIGCTLCIQACPVDAVVGGPKLMHTILASECSGCDLCLPACPVDCIDIEFPAITGPASDTPWSGFTRTQAQHFQYRFDQRTERLDAGPLGLRNSAGNDLADLKRQITESVARVRSRRNRARGADPGTGE
tara:strand:- start:99 stop:755 length:657 start_codon:yes stop_codon:yes gene_type:complete